MFGLQFSFSNSGGFLFAVDAYLRYAKLTRRTAKALGVFWAEVGAVDQQITRRRVRAEFVTCIGGRQPMWIVIVASLAPTQ